jgi:pyruvate ferredoxin oxidoreductase alpha subunit
VSIGAMVGPEAFMEVRYIAHAKQTMALDLIPAIAADFAATFGREAGGLLRSYRVEDADTIVVALGSVVGTLEETIDAMRDEGILIGLVSIRSYRPFPMEAVKYALKAARRVVVVEKSFSVGLGGVVSADVRMALAGRLHLRTYTVVAGLGGRPITQASLRRILGEAVEDRLKMLTFLDLNHEVVNRQLAREAAERRTGPIAENLLRDIGGRKGKAGGTL